jgi:oligosaccharide repeat unit polymerase
VALGDSKQTVSADPALNRSLPVATALLGALALVVVWTTLRSASPWAAWFYIAFAVAACAINRSVLRAGWFSWINTYLVISTLAIAGYPALVGAHILSAESFMPPLDSASTHVAIAVAGVAIIAIEVGALASYFVPTALRASAASNESVGQLLRRLGLVVAIASAALILELFHSLGGVAVLSGGHYQQYMNTLNQTSPAFGTLGVDYFPLGLIAYYLGLLLETDRSRRFRRRRLLVMGAFCVFAMVFLVIGDRNTPLLTGVALLYVHHHFGSRIRIRMAMAILVVGIGALVLVGQVRNSSVSQTSLGHGILDPIIGTFRPFEQFVTFFTPGLGSEHHLGMIMYVNAAKEAVPFSDRTIPKGSVVRSSVLITQLASPISAQLNIYEGGSNVGEGFATFGLWGVFLTSLLVGLSIAVIERQALLGRGIVALIVLALTFTSSLFYIRDDVFGMVRNVVWALALAAVLAVPRAVSRLPESGRRSTARGRSLASPRSP